MTVIMCTAMAAISAWEHHDCKGLVKGTAIYEKKQSQRAVNILPIVTAYTPLYVVVSLVLKSNLNPLPVIAHYCNN